MVWYFIFMITGVMLFALGISLGMRFISTETKHAEEKYEPQEEDAHMLPRIKRQWENLLSYDGTEQGEDLDEN